MCELQCPVAAAYSSQSASAADGGNPASSKKTVVHAAGLQTCFFVIVNCMQSTLNIHTERMLFILLRDEMLQTRSSCHRICLHLRLFVFYLIMNEDLMEGRRPPQSAHSGPVEHSNSWPLRDSFWSFEEMEKTKVVNQKQ